VTRRGVRVAPRRAVLSERRQVRLDEIDVPKRRLRRDMGDLGALAVSLHLHGQLAPVIVYAQAGRYRLVAGERRLEALRRLHGARVAAGEAAPGSMPLLDVLVRPFDLDEDPVEIELVENSQRQQLGDDEEADALIQLVRDQGRDLQEVAALAGRSVAYISKRIRVFEDAALRRALQAGHLTTSHAEELLVLPEGARPALVRRLVDEGLSFKELREAVQAAIDSAGRELTPPASAGAAEWVEGDFEELDDEALRDVDSEHSFRIENAPRVRLERPGDLTRRIRDLALILEGLRPFQLTPQDDRALERLWKRLKTLARAPRQPAAVVFPSLQEAEAAASVRNRRT
jgi:ParB family chromosome partitioning protein